MNQNLCCLSLWQTSSSALTGVKDGKPCHLDMDVNVSVCRHNRLQQLIADLHVFLHILTVLKYQRIQSVPETIVLPLSLSFFP